MKPSGTDVVSSFLLKTVLGLILEVLTILLNKLFAQGFHSDTYKQPKQSSSLKRVTRIRKQLPSYFCFAYNTNGVGESICKTVGHLLYNSVDNNLLNLEKRETVPASQVLCTELERSDFTGVAPAWFSSCSMHRWQFVEISE